MRSSNNTAKSKIGFHLRMEDVYRPMNLTGKKMYLRIMDGRCNADSYPFMYYDQTVPVKITGEYEKFLMAEVLEHEANTTARFGPSRPYSVTIPKFSLHTGSMVLSDKPNIPRRAFETEEDEEEDVVVL